ncbi:MAG: heavy-metal-associated domain-containing protein [Elusimicrobia bacterium]|nr:heavy-metal-associated domain-containing protein [Elusimicrobiota bacterium]
MKNLIIKIKGLKCSGCCASLKSALEEKEGIISAEISLEKGEAKITYDEKIIGEDLIEKTIKENGREVIK